MKDFKKYIFPILFMIGMYLCGVAVGINLFDKHDVNRDGKVTAQDYVEVKNYIMEQ